MRHHEHHGTMCLLTSSAILQSSVCFHVYLTFENIGLPETLIASASAIVIMFIVGLTGGISTGKSTVASVFREHGIPVIDADIIAREVVEPGTKAWKKIKAEFGEDALLPSGHLNRERVGEIIFSDINLRRKLNEWTHPEIHRKIMLAVLSNFLQGHKYVVLDLPLLFESGVMLSYIYKVICVSCTPEQQLQRLINRNSMSEALAKQRIAAQMSLESKCQKSHYVVDNSGSIDSTQEQALKLLSIFNESWEYWRIRFYIGIISLCLILPVYYFFYY